MTCLNSKLLSKKYFKIELAILLLMAIITAFVFILGKIFYINTSASAPIGIYVNTFSKDIEYGDFYAVKMPIDMPKLDAYKGDLILKKVCGKTGDQYRVNENYIEIHGRKYPIYPSKNLPHLQIGEYTVAKHQTLFLNDPDVSFDSRYLGAIDNSLVGNKLVLLFPLNWLS